ncbi:MAG: hypothetical protein HKN82_20515 [Akkermansiaceae bacterium]|nr:hypothetical protein [Akkermansiaceae bacterium]
MASVSAQGLYNLMPFDDEASDSLPLNWTVGANIGYDDNPTPIGSGVAGGGGSSGEAYGDAYVQANFVNQDPQTTLDVWVRLGIIYYFDEIRTVNAVGTVVNTEDTFYQTRGGLNLVHRVNERLRIRSRNSLAYETEPDYSYGVGADRRQGQYFRWSSDNSFGYRWSERFGTNTGWRVQGVSYDDLSGSDYISNLLYNEFRYRATPQTVWTASYRYGFTDDDSGPDSNSQFFLVGAEHQFSPTTVGVVRVGGQLFQPDAGSDTWAPYIEGMLRSQVNEQFSLRGFLRYGIEPYNRRIATNNAPMPIQSSLYDDHSVLRVGVQGSYAISPRLAVFGGGHIIHETYDDLVAGSTTPAPPPAAPGSFDETILNLNIGGSVQVTENVYLTGSYNFTDSSSDSNIREYDRNRFQLGVQATF